MDSIFMVLLVQFLFYFPNKRRKMVPNNSPLKRRQSFRGWLKKNVLPTASRKPPVPSQPTPHQRNSQPIFGVPLCESVCYARSTLGYMDEEGIKHSRAGAIPIIMAKCGAFLKKYALYEEGIFRMSGSMKRINELEEIFDSSSTMYGLYLDWTAYTVHDAASILRRFLNRMPDPVIPHSYFHAFRDVMSDKVCYTTKEKIRVFQHLIQSLPSPHQHLLLYLLDMLNMFAINTHENRMNSSNLAAIFCPGLLTHPDYISVVHYKISQCVIEFLIEFQELFTMKLLIGVSASTEQEERPPVPPLPECFSRKNLHIKDPKQTRELFEDSDKTVSTLSPPPPNKTLPCSLDMATLTIQPTPFDRMDKVQPAKEYLDIKANIKKPISQTTTPEMVNVYDHPCGEKPMHGDTYSVESEDAPYEMSGALKRKTSQDKHSASQASMPSVSQHTVRLSSQSSEAKLDCDTLQHLPDAYIWPSHYESADRLPVNNVRFYITSLTLLCVCVSIYNAY
ncbi:Rho GTPase activation protein [Spinellus fusiger]|nr:Rho GTPase activation protein [Spinellus fusiger]